MSSSPAQLNVQQPEPQETTATAVLEPPANTAQDNHDGSIFGAKDAPSEVLLGHSMPEISQQITPASLPSANDKPDVQAVKPLKMAKSSGMRAMLGRKAAKAISALLGPVTAVDTRTTHSKKVNLKEVRCNDELLPIQVLIMGVFWRGRAKHQRQLGSACRRCP